MESARNSICKEMNLQGTELERNGGGICKEWTLQGMRTVLCLSQFRIGDSIWPAIAVYVI